jgi:hypothetical protein
MRSSSLRRQSGLRPGLRACPRWLTFVLALLAMVVAPRSARADQSTAHSVSVAVLGFDSDDAEEQADALTGALRSRVRASQGWSLVETTQSLGMLTAALRCSGKSLGADCAQRISEQIKSDRYIFGYVTKGPQPAQVTAEVHLYQKGKPDAVVRESYADNLKDANDDTVRKIAQRFLDKLGGNAVGVIVVRMGSESGEVIIDGDKRVPLANGAARVELSPGSHSVEVAVTGQPVQKRNVLVAAGKETTVDLAQTAPPSNAEPPKPDRPFPTRKVVGGGLAVVGAVGGALAIVNLVSYFDDQDKGTAHQNTPTTNPADPKLPPGKTADDVCGSQFQDSYTICRANSDATRHSTIALVSGIAGGALLGVGAYLLLFDGSSDKEKPGVGKTGKTGMTIKANPTFGRGTGALVLSGSF